MLCGTHFFFAEGESGETRSVRGDMSSIALSLCRSLRETDRTSPSPSCCRCRPPRCLRLRVIPRLSSHTPAFFAARLCRPVFTESQVGHERPPKARPDDEILRQLATTRSPPHVSSSTTSLVVSSVWESISLQAFEKSWTESSHVPPLHLEQPPALEFSRVSVARTSCPHAP